MTAQKNQIPKEQVRFPIRKEDAIRLVLQRRRSSLPQQTEHHEGSTRGPHFLVPALDHHLGAPTLMQAPGEEREKMVMTLEARLQETERRAKELEHILAERNRDLAEIEALLKARASSSSKPDKRPLSFEEKIRIERLRSELERKDIALQEQKKLIEERERFLSENEEKLFTKMQEHQERETQLEQLAEELAELKNRLDGKPSTAQQLREKGAGDEFKD